MLKKRAKQLAYTIFLLLGLVFAIAFSAVLFLQSQSGSNWVLQQVSKKLSADGIAITASRSSFAAFSGIHLQNLRVSWQPTSSDAKKADSSVKQGALLTIEKLDFDYHFSLFAKSFEVRDLIVISPELQFEGVSESQAQPQARSDTPGSTLAQKLVRLREWLEKPPVNVRLRNVSVEHLKVRAKLLTQQAGIDTGAFNVVVTDLSARLQADLTAGEFKTSGQYQTGPALTLSFNAHDQTGGHELALTAESSASWEAKVSKIDGQNDNQKDGQWTYEIKPSHMKAELSNFVQHQLSLAVPGKPESEQDFRLRSLVFEASTSFLARSAELFALSRDTIERSDSKAQLDLTGLRILGRENAQTATKPLSKTVSSASGKLAEQLAERLAEQLAVAHQTILVDSTLPGDLLTKFVWAVSGFEMPGLTLAPAGFRTEGQIKLARDLRRAQLNVETQWLGKLEGNSRPQVKKLLALKADLMPEFDNDPAQVSGTVVAQKKPLLRALKFDGSAHMELEPRLAQTLAAAAPLKKFGLLSVDLTVAGTHPLDATVPTNAQFTAAVPSVQLPGSVDPWGVKAEGSLHLLQNPPGTNKINFDGQVALANRDFGGWVIRTLTQAMNSAEGLTSTGQTTITYNQTAELRSMPNFKFAIPEPFHISHDVAVGNHAPLSKELNSLKSRQMRLPDHAIVDLQLPELDVKSFGKVSQTHLKFNLNSADLKAAQNLDLSMTLDQGRIVLPAAYEKYKVPINGLAIKLKAALRNGTSFILDELQADINKDLLQFSATASGNLARKDIQGRSHIQMHVPNNFPDFSGQKVRGSLDIPILLSVRHGEEIELSGDIGLDNFSWQKGDIGFAGLSGQIPFSEHLFYRGKEFGFSHLITENPFERVNFQPMRPLLDDSQQLLVEEIRWYEKTYGPLIGYVSFQQNMISLHQFDLDLITGRLYGELFVNAYPKTLQLGVLSRMTGLDLTEILPQRFLTRTPTGDQTLSGRSGFVLDLNKSTIDGRIDITQIGGTQLSTMINLLDPTYEDEKMNKVRSLLGVGYPTAVALSFQEGYLDMGVDVTALGVSQHLNLRGIPVSGLISNASHEFLAKDAPQNKSTENAPKNKKVPKTATKNVSRGN